MRAWLIGVGLAALGCGRIGFDQQPSNDAPATCVADLDVDADNCGACGHGCLGGTCEAGACTPVRVALSQNDPRQILLDGDFAYWAGNDRIARAPKAGGTVETIATFSGWGFRMIAFGGFVYWVTRDTGLVLRAAMAPNSTVETIATGQGDVSGIAADGTSTYWAVYPNGNAFRSTGGAPIPLLPTTTSMLAGIQLVGEKLYFARESIGVFEVASTGGTASMLAPAGTFEIVVDGDDIFAASVSGDKLVRVSRSTGAMSEVADADAPWGIAVDATHVYYANEGAGTIARAPRGGGAMEILATSDQPVGIAVDELAVYWTDRNGDIMKVAK